MGSRLGLVVLVLATPACSLDSVAETAATDSDGSSSGSSGPGSSSASGAGTSGTTSSSTTAGSSATVGSTSTGSTSGTSGAGSGSSTGGCTATWADAGWCSDDPPDGMVAFSAATFSMGCDIPSDVPDCGTDEYPVRDVHLNAYAIDETEVTVDDYGSCVDGGGCSARDTSSSHCNPGDGDGTMPANCVTWDQAQAYCGWLGERLPTEAEWEHAAEGTSETLWPWGDTPTASCDVAIMHDQPGYGCGTGSSWAVGSRPAGATPTGLDDMVGNVDEWTGDWWSPMYVADISDPTGPLAGAEKVARGGGFDDDAGGVRLRRRIPVDPATGLPNVGFRCALQAQ